MRWHIKLLAAASIMAATTLGAFAEDIARVKGPSYNDDGSVVRPTDWETWVFVGSPLTPNALNGGSANFKEFHSVYIEPEAFKVFTKTGKFPNGTQLVKARTFLYQGDDCGDVDETNGSCAAVSGRGYFNGDYSGFELTVKDTERFKDPGGWVYYNFGESPSEWADSAEPFPAEACNSCHDAAAANDFVFTQFYPVLRDSEPKVNDSRQNAGTKPVKKAEATPASSSEGGSTHASNSVIPVEVNALFKFLQDGEYKKFKNFEEKPHPSAGPHVKYGKPVQVYYDDVIAESLKAGNKSHPAGSGIVKELYNDDASKLIGWAVSVKTDEDSNKGKGWFWVEFVSTDDVTKVAAPAENGSGACIGCHGRGNDYVMSKFHK